MRRQDREIRSMEDILNVMDKCAICRLGLYDRGEVYVVPLSFGYLWEEGVLTLYFHGAKEGRKLDVMRDCPEVGFEMDCGYELHESDIPCQVSCAYESVIGNGRAALVEDPDEKCRGLEALLRAGTGREYKVDARMAAAAAVWKVTVHKITGKRHM